MKIAHVVHGFLPEHDGGTERYVDAMLAFSDRTIAEAMEGADVFLGVSV